MTELDKLEQYLKNNDIEYVRIDDANERSIEVAKEVGMYTDAMFERQQIIVMKDGKRQWDAVCHWGSYGYRGGLLEVMGPAVIKKADGDEVCGYLTAQDVIDRLEGRA